MENGLILQFLVVAGVIAYGVWNATQKNAEQKREQDNREREGNVDSQQEQDQMTWEDYFPSSVEMSTQSKSVDQVRGDKQKNQKSSQIESKNGGKYNLATSSIEMTNGSTEDMGEDPIMEDGKQGLVTDLRTIIISSELLKPKYLEY